MESNNKLSPRKEFYKCGNCTKAMFHVLNGEFQNTEQAEENASDLLTAVISQREYPCGFLWATALSVGTESLKRYDDKNKAAAAAVIVTGRMLNAFKKQNKAVNCWDITHSGWDNKVEHGFYLAKRLLFGATHGSCFNMIERWTPEAVKVISQGLNSEQVSDEPVTNCASEVVRRMGGSEEDAVRAAGFAGGIGLSGNACGALSAAIWYRKLANLGKREEDEFAAVNPNLKKVMRTFYIQTDSEISCSKICGKKFSSLKEHSDYIANGGCAAIIKALSEI